MQNSLFDLENRYASLSKTGEPLERLNAIIDWEIFRPILQSMDEARKSNAGRKPTCRILMFKMLILQRLNGLSDERLQLESASMRANITLARARKNRDIHLWTGVKKAGKFERQSEYKPMHKSA